MNSKYINIYNNLVNLTRNKDIYVNFTKNDTFSDRLIIFLFHFAFILKVFKKDNTKQILQEIYDYIFKQLELSIREIGYGDVSINKKMKIYINSFYSIIDRIDDWDNLDNMARKEIFDNYLDKHINNQNIVDYFEKFRIFLLNNTLNSLIKGVIKLNF